MKFEIISEKELIKAYKEKRPTGRWEARQGVPHCSNCGEEAITEWNTTGGAWIMTPFCPFCGARMERAKEATDV